MIAAPSSTKNEKKERDPDARQVKKGNQWYFGYKGHIAVDRDTGLVKKIETTAANVHDVTQVAGLMDGTEKGLYGNSGYLGAEKREEAILTNNQGKEIQYIICARPSSLKKRYTGTKYEKAAAAEHTKASMDWSEYNNAFRHREYLHRVNSLRVLDQLHNIIHGTAQRAADFDQRFHTHILVFTQLGHGVGADLGRFDELRFTHTFVDKQLP